MSPRVSVPTTGSLPSSLRVDPSNPIVNRILSRLSRSSLISVALDWLDPNNLQLALPYLRYRSGDSDDGSGDDDDDDDEADDFYPPARSPEALRQFYSDLQARKGSKREVLDRIIEGDWRHGLTLYQLAMADLQYLYDHPTSQKWSAYRVVPLRPPRDLPGDDGDEDAPVALAEVDRTSLAIPRFHPSTFLRTLQTQVLPDVKAHYNFDTHPSLPLLILRIFVLDSPYNTNLGLHSHPPNAAASPDASRTVYIAFPDASPHVFISRPQSTTAATTILPSTTTTTTTSSSSAASGPAPSAAAESKSLRALLVDAIPKALARPLRRQRFALRPTSLVTRNLAELVARRGGGRTNAAGGGWSAYADEGAGANDRRRESPLDLVREEVKGRVDAEAGSGRKGKRAGGGGGREDRKEGGEEPPAKRARLVARARFGDTALVGDGKGVERVDVVIEDAVPGVRGLGGPAPAADADDGDGGNGNGNDGEQPQRGRRGPMTGRRKSQVDEILERAARDDDEDDGLEEAGVGGGEEEGREGEEDQTWRPRVRLTFHGSHVFAGIRQLVERGIIDGERMPGWMTGEEGVTIGAVRNGRIRGHHGSGV